MQSKFEEMGDFVLFHVPLRLPRKDLAMLLRDTDVPERWKSSVQDGQRYRSLLNIAQDLLAFERARKAIPGLEGMLGDPVWLILLDLFVREAEGKTTTVSSATLASGAPATSGLRYVTALTSMGFLKRARHPDDERSILLSLSNEARTAIGKILQKAD